jgi:hypothetical protein
MRWCVSDAPPSVGATCGHTSQWKRPTPADAWATSSSASLKRSGRMCGQSSPGNWCCHRFSGQTAPASFATKVCRANALHGGRYGWRDVDGGQGEAVRTPQADGTLVALPVGEDDALMPSLLTLTDVMGCALFEICKCERLIEDVRGQRSRVSRATCGWSWRRAGELDRRDVVRAERGRTR